MKLNVMMLCLFIGLISCEHEYVRKEYNDPNKILNIQNLDTNKLYVCVSPDTYKKLMIQINDTVIFNDSNLTIDFVPAKLVYTMNSKPKSAAFKIIINDKIDTSFTQELNGVHKIMFGTNSYNQLHYRTNNDVMAWIVD